MCNPKNVCVGAYMYDSDFWFSLGRKGIYDYDSDYGSVEATPPLNNLIVICQILRDTWAAYARVSPFLLREGGKMRDPGDEVGYQANLVPRLLSSTIFKMVGEKVEGKRHYK